MTVSFIFLCTWKGQHNPLCYDKTLNTFRQSLPFRARCPAPIYGPTPKMENLSSLSSDKKIIRSFLLKLLLLHKSCPAVTCVLLKNEKEANALNTHTIKTVLIRQSSPIKGQAFIHGILSYRTAHTSARPKIVLPLEFMVWLVLTLVKIPFWIKR